MVQCVNVCRGTDGKWWNVLMYVEELREMVECVNVCGGTDGKWWNV